MKTSSFSGLVGGLRPAKVPTVWRTARALAFGWASTSASGSCASGPGCSASGAGSCACRGCWESSRTLRPRPRPRPRPPRPVSARPWTGAGTSCSLGSCGSLGSSGGWTWDSYQAEWWSQWTLVVEKNWALKWLSRQVQGPLGSCNSWLTPIKNGNSQNYYCILASLKATKKR